MNTSLKTLCFSHSLTEVFIFLSIARFVLGVGVGGVYPLAATVAAEGSSSECLGNSFGTKPSRN